MKRRVGGQKYGCRMGTDGVHVNRNVVVRQADVGFMQIEMWWYDRQRCGGQVDRNVVVRQAKMQGSCGQKCGGWQRCGGQMNKNVVVGWVEMWMMGES